MWNYLLITGGVGQAERRPRHLAASERYQNGQLTSSASERRRVAAVGLFLKLTSRGRGCGQVFVELAQQASAVSSNARHEARVNIDVELFGTDVCYLVFDRF